MPDAVSRLEQAKRLPAGFLAGLGITTGTRGIVKIPYFGPTGELLFIREQRPAGSVPRFRQPQAVRLQPYGLWRLHEAQKTRTLFLVEGESDTWALWAEKLPALGLPGSNSTGCLQAEHLDSLDVIWAAPDLDKGGEAFVAGLRKRLGELGFQGQLRVVRLPMEPIRDGAGKVVGNKDLSDFRCLDPGTFTERLAAAMDKAEVVRLKDRKADSTSNGSTSGTGAVLQARLTCLADVEPESISWLWRGRIALGKLTLIAGRPGTGKSFVTCDLAARVSSGSLLPDCVFTRFAKGDVVMMSCEDGLADTIVPRVLAAGADCRRIHKLDAVTVTSNGNVTAATISLAHVDVIEQGLDRFPDCKLLIIDPLGGFIGSKVDTSQDNQVRAALEGLRQLVERRKIACVLVAHTRKASVTYADDAILGSRAFSGLVRQVWHLCEDDNDRERRLLLPGKVNLRGATKTGLAFRIEEPGRLVWEPDPVLMHADDAVASAGGRDQVAPQRAAATAWLSELLRNGAVESDTIKEQASQAGLSWATVRRAKDDLGIVPFKQGFSGKWMWQLPPQDTQKNDNGVASPGSERPSDEDAHAEDAHGETRRCSAHVASVGLIEAEKRLTVGQFLAAWLKARKESGYAAASLVAWGQITSELTELFGDRPLISLTHADGETYQLAMRSRGARETTIAKRLISARSMLEDALRLGHISANPFRHVRQRPGDPSERRAYVSVADTVRVIEACPNVWMRLLLALARFGGLRTPSEPFSLKWEGVNWERNRLVIISPKGKASRKGTRVIPIFPLLRPHLEAAWEAAPEGAEYVFLDDYRRRAQGERGWVNCNVRTALERIVIRAGLKPWPRLWHSLRASCESGLAQHFPLAVVTKWLGNTPSIAMRHYVDVTEEAFQKATEWVPGGTESGTPAA